MVKCFSSGSRSCVARPKSPIFRFMEEVSSRLDSVRSRCRMPWVCRYSIPHTICCMKCRAEAHTHTHTPQTLQFIQNDNISQEAMGILDPPHSSLHRMRAWAQENSQEVHS